GDMVTAVACAEAELMRCPGSVLEHDRCEVRMLELGASPLGDQRVEAARAYPARLFGGERQVNRVIGGHSVPAIFAALGAFAHAHGSEQTRVGRRSSTGCVSAGLGRYGELYDAPEGEPRGREARPGRV